MNRSVLHRSAMSIGTCLVTGSLLLTGAGQATAATPTATPTPAPTATPTPAPQVAATVTNRQTVRVRVTRKVTVTVTRALTSEVKVTKKGTRTVTRVRAATRSRSATRHAETTAEARAEAAAAARRAARAAATTAARGYAAKAAAKHARYYAKIAAARAARAGLRARFGTVALRHAAAQRGKPYAWGGDGPSSFDCSGLVRYVMRKAGVTGLPRTSRAIAADTKRLAKSSKRKGDLIFFHSGGRVYHAAIYAGSGRVWHAPGSGRTVRKVTIWSGSYRVGRAA